MGSAAPTARTAGMRLTATAGNTVSMTRRCRMLRHRDGGMVSIYTKIIIRVLGLRTWV
jgi:hypothetical protein